MFKTYLKNLLLAFAFAIGILVPEAARGAWLIQYLIIAMLLLTFMRMDAPWRKLRPLHFKLLAANVVIALTAWGAFRFLGMERFAETAFYIGITPTAAAAPVIVGMLGADIEFTTVAVCLSNIAMALLLPLLLGMVGGASVSAEVCLHSLASMAKVVLLPALLAVILRSVWSGSKEMALRCIGVTFYLWIGVLLLAAAKSSQYLHTSHQSILTLFGLAGISLGLCVVCFALGRRIGRPDHRLECSQVLGQKNTTLTICFSLLYADPLATLGLTFYVFWHNTCNALQLHFHAMEKRKVEHADFSPK